VGEATIIYRETKPPQLSGNETLEELFALRDLRLSTHCGIFAVGSKRFYRSQILRSAPHCVFFAADSIGVINVITRFSGLNYFFISIRKLIGCEVVNYYGLYRMNLSHNCNTECLYLFY